MFSAHPMLPNVRVLLELSEEPEPPLPPHPAKPRRPTPASVPPLSFSMSLRVNLSFMHVPFKSLHNVCRSRPSSHLLRGASPPSQPSGPGVGDDRQDRDPDPADKGAPGIQLAEARDYRISEPPGPDEGGYDHHR